MIAAGDTLLMGALAVYLLAALGFAAARGDRLVRVGRSAVSLTVLAFALHGAGLLVRTIAGGRAPWGNMFEFATSSSFAAVGAYLVIGRRTGQLRPLGLLALLPVSVTMTLAMVVLYDQPGPLVPALRSGWLNIHVSAAVVAVGAVTIGTIGCAVQLHAQHRQLPQRAATADEVARAAFAFAFPVWTFAVTTGAIWAERAWGRYWGWDPKEVWAFVTWVVLAAYLHARHTASVRRGATAAIGLVAYGVLLFNFVAVNIWFGGLHTYSGR